MALPANPLTLMKEIYRNVMPAVHRELAGWRRRAGEIPNLELRNQALASIRDKTFHCEGGSIMALTALDGWREAIRFIVAYQTISDYLDNLCDRSTSLDPADFTALHESMPDALTPGAEPGEYYRCRKDREDGGYLKSLVHECQSVLADLPHYDLIRPYLLELCSYYCELQVHKHVRAEEREERLQKWFAAKGASLPDMDWFEFSACSGSTLGIFCLVSYAFRGDFTKEHALMIREGYFPYIQGLHILLDYFIDQKEDRAGGDLNFCCYYESDSQMMNRFIHFLAEADRHTNRLPDMKFHRLLNRGLLGIYLSDEKVNEQKEVKKMAAAIMKKGGPAGYFFYWNGKAYRKIRKLFSGSARKAAEAS